MKMGPGAGNETICDLALVGDVVADADIVRNGVLCISSGRIVDVRPDPAEVHAARIDEYRGCYLLPGAVDTHVHTLSAPTEGVLTASEAAAVGGVTTVVDMPYDGGAPINSVERLVAKGAVVEAGVFVDVALLGTLQKGGDVRVLTEMVRAGAVGFKLSTYETDPTRFPKIDNGTLLAAFGTLAEAQVPLVIHAEDQEVIDYCRRECADGPVSDGPGLHERVRPKVAESAAIASVLELALWSGARVHIAHITHPRGFDLVNYFRTCGARVSGETCPHYLLLTDADVVRLGAEAKVNPPIRDSAAREGLWELIKSDSVWSIATDHAPWPITAKSGSFAEAASGVPGLETLLPSVVSEALRRGVPIPSVAALLSGRPASLVGLSQRKGRLAPGFDADVAVVDVSRTTRFAARHATTSAKWSPFDGREFRARVAATYLGGELVAKDGKAVSSRLRGRWLRGTVHGAASGQ